MPANLDLNNNNINENNNNSDLWIRTVSLNSGEFINEFALNTSTNFDCTSNEIFYVDALNRTLILDEIYSSIKIYDLPNSSTCAIKTSLNKDQANLLIETKSFDLTNSSAFRMTSDAKLIFVRDKKTIEFYSFS
jgi:hypothetical protein